MYKLSVRTLNPNVTQTRRHLLNTRRVVRYALNMICVGQLSAKRYFVEFDVSDIPDQVDAWSLPFRQRQQTQWYLHLCEVNGPDGALLFATALATRCGYRHQRRVTAVGWPRNAVAATGPWPHNGWSRAGLQIEAEHGSHSAARHPTSFCKSEGTGSVGATVNRERNITYAESEILHMLRVKYHIMSRVKYHICQNRNTTCAESKIPHMPRLKYQIFRE